MRGVWWSEELKSLAGERLLWDMQQSACESNQHIFLYSYDVKQTEVCRNIGYYQLVMKVQMGWVLWYHHTPQPGQEVKCKEKVLGCLSYQPHRAWEAKGSLKKWSEGTAAALRSQRSTILSTEVATSSCKHIHRQEHISSSEDDVFLLKTQRTTHFYEWKCNKWEKKMLVSRQNRNWEDHVQQHGHALPNPIKWADGVTWTFPSIFKVLFSRPNQAEVQVHRRKNWSESWRQIPYNSHLTHIQDQTKQTSKPSISIKSPCESNWISGLIYRFPLSETHKIKTRLKKTASSHKELVYTELSSSNKPTVPSATGQAHQELPKGKP